MGIQGERLDAAIQRQHNAARDANTKIRLIAGPGTGKSFVIEERVRWLIQDIGIAPNAIHAISFTRAASKDLKNRIVQCCIANGINNHSEIRVSTLHSLALYILRRAGLLTHYPVNPIVLDTWELRHIYDNEFSRTNQLTIRRCQEIRSEHEALWSTGKRNPPNYNHPDEPISEEEREAFVNFHGPRTRLYSCVLPGEIVRKCVDNINNGLISINGVLDLDHLIVDEVQDLNPCDFEFINILIDHNISVFISGDDDQSIYSFRYAFPTGIQTFTEIYEDSSDHQLVDCFRCPTNILNAAYTLLHNFSSPNRVRKSITSVYENSDPPLNGTIKAFSYSHQIDEARSIGNSIRKLINGGINPNDILVLLNNKRAQLSPIEQVLQELEVAYETSIAAFNEAPVGRIIYAMLRIVCNPEDYIAYRSLLKFFKGVGDVTIIRIGNKCLNNNINFPSLFTNAIPEGVFNAREERAINHLRSLINAIQDWTPIDTIEDRTHDIDSILLHHFDLDTEIEDWHEFISVIPDATNLKELKSLLSSSNESEKDLILSEIFDRLGVEQDEREIQPKVKIMTYHASKGLSAEVVFIPGLENDYFPGTHRQGNAGQILEAARMLFVAITRAKVACYISFARRKADFRGNPQYMQPSQFCSHLNLGFEMGNTNGLDEREVSEITYTIDNR